MFVSSAKRSPLPLTLFSFFILFLGLFTFLVIHVLVKKNIDMDDAVATYLIIHYNEGIGNLMKIFTGLGSPLFLIIGYSVIFLFYAFYRKDLKLALRLLATGAAGYVIMVLLKLIFHRTRPLHPLIHALNSFSFPSGHTTTSIIFFGILIHLICKERISLNAKICWSTFLIILGLMVGLSRVYLREHFFTDVLAGISVAYIVLYLTLFFFEKFQPIAKIQGKFASDPAKR